MQERVKRKKPPNALTAPVPDPMPIDRTVFDFWPCLPAYSYREVSFIYRGKPIGKPRMTQRDKWQKRPCVLRYRDFADRIRASAGSLSPEPDLILITAYVAMPPSWSETVKASMDQKPCRQRPDFDNICKATMDALFDEDSSLWLGLTVKYWCRPGQERLHVKIFYAQPQTNPA